MSSPGSSRGGVNANGLGLGRVCRVISVIVETKRTDRDAIGYYCFANRPRPSESDSPDDFGTTGQWVVVFDIDEADFVVETRRAATAEHCFAMVMAMCPDIAGSCGRVAAVRMVEHVVLFAVARLVASRHTGR